MTPTHPSRSTDDPIRARELDIILNRPGATTVTHANGQCTVTLDRAHLDQLIDMATRHQLDCHIPMVVCP